MAVYYELLTPEQKNSILTLIGVQAYITEISSIEYQCYFEKINLATFWYNHCWKDNQINFL